MFFLVMNLMYLFTPYIYIYIFKWDMVILFVYFANVKNNNNKHIIHIKS